METIVKAKDQQAAEANKNASILLKELDLEKVSLNSIHFPVRFPGRSCGPHLMKGRQGAHLGFVLCVALQSREESKKQALAVKREKRKGEAQEEEGGAEEEAGGRGGAEDEGGVL